MEKPDDPTWTDYAAENRARPKAPVRRVPDSKKIRKLKIGLTPFLHEVVDEVSGHAECTRSRAIRALLFLGYARWRELGCKLPEMDR